MKYPAIFGLSCLFLIAITVNGPTWFQKQASGETESPSEAGAAFQAWSMARSFPDGKFYTEKYVEALAQMRLNAQLRGGADPEWTALGPKNIGGRTLCMAVNPLDTNELWLGSASGGIWKSTTAGNGAEAWQRVETGFPVLGVSSIALDPVHPNVIYAGTGEVYNVENSSPNVAIRVTRGTYGIGILKSTDGGATWTKSLDWAYGQLRGVLDIKINPLRTSTVYAATSEGLLRSWDAGATWQTVHAKRMAVDIEINPQDTNIVYVTHGSLDDQDVSGVYRSVNGGQTFALLSNGIPTSYSGKTLLTLCASKPQVLYASVADAFAQQGLYKTTNGGTSWTQVSSSDVCTYQGWYSHDVAVNPNIPETLVWVGIDAWRSTNSGAALAHTTYWYNWTFGEVPAGGAEGPADYAHADMHRVYYAPGDPNKVYVVTDGGLFVSYDGGNTWSGRNGGYQSQQFYANTSSSATDPNLIVGGMQDNATAVYYGSPSWYRCIGGDGECAGVNPLDDNIMYGSSQYLNMAKSIDRGQNWYGIGGEINENAAFNGPFEISSSNPDIMYAGAESLWRSDTGGDSWSAVTDVLSPGDVILTIAIDPENPDIVYCSTVPLSSNVVKLFRIDVINGAVDELSGLPNRMCMDIALHPTASGTILAVFAGFNTQHVWQSFDFGSTWAAIDNGLPDVPTNSIVVDPASGYYYVGNDLGVWISKNAGANWEWYSAKGPQAMLAMHLSIAPGNKLRVASYGLGVWETDLEQNNSAVKTPESPVLKAIFPNPAVVQTSVDFSLCKREQVTLKILDQSGKICWKSAPEWLPAGNYSRNIPLDGVPGGSYALVMESGKNREGKVLTVIR